MQGASTSPAAAADGALRGTAVSRAAWRAGGVLLVVTGGFIAVYMTIAMFHEIMRDSFFGMSVSAMCVVFGGLLVRDGLYLAAGRRVSRAMAELTSLHRTTYAPSMGHPHGEPADPARCAMTVYTDWQCGNPRGHGPEAAYCYRHAKTVADTPSA